MALTNRRHEEARAKQRFLHAMGPAHAAMNKILYEFFPEYAKLLSRLKTTLSVKEPLIRQALTNLQSLYTALTCHSNRMTWSHNDDNNPLYGIEALIVLGNFCQGGYFLIPQLGLRIKALPGTVLFFRARAFEHAVEDWEPRRWRLSVAHYISSATLDGHLGTPAGTVLAGNEVDMRELATADEVDLQAGDQVLLRHLQSDYRGHVAANQVFTPPHVALDVYSPEDA